MRVIMAGASLALLAACGGEPPTDCCAKTRPEAQTQTGAPKPETADYISPPGVDPQVAAACSSGLVTRGLEENELWLITHEPDGVCPNMGVTEARIREIIAKDWDAAGCTQYTREQMLNALNSGHCGGDAG
jgi:hypothetical protein